MKVAVAAVAAVVLLAGCSSGSGTPAACGTACVTTTHDGSSPLDTTVPSDTPVPVEVKPAPSSAAPAGGKLGDTLTYTNAATETDITVSALRRVPKLSQFYGPAKGVVYQVTVLIVGKKGRFEVNPLNFTARSAAGDSYNVALGATDVQLADGAVAAGQRLRGPVAFDVPKGVTIAVVVLDIGFGASSATWKA